MQIFKTKLSARLTRRERISDESLRDAIERAERGLIDADLGAGLIKQRVARSGRGKSGGYRMIVAYRSGDRAVFLYAFAKSERQNIDTDELQDLRQLGANWLNASRQQIEDAVEKGVLEEIRHGRQKEEA